MNEVKFDPTQAEQDADVAGAKVHWRRDEGANRLGRKVRVYVDITDGSIDLVEDLTNRRRRPHLDWKPRVAEVLRQLGYEDLRLRWSQSAGCSCGCSPGFIVEDGMRYGLFTGDMWITFTDPSVPTVDDTKPPRELI